MVRNERWKILNWDRRYKTMMHMKLLTVRVGESLQHEEKERERIVWFNYKQRSQASIIGNGSFVQQRGQDRQLWHSLSNIYIYIYIYIQRERERVSKGMRKKLWKRLLWIVSLV